MISIDSFVFKAAVVLIDGGLVLLLPETKGKPLPETIEDAENMHRYSYAAYPREKDISKKYATFHLQWAELHRNPKEESLNHLF